MTDETETTADEAPAEEAAPPAGGLFLGPQEDGVATPDEQASAYQQALLREREGYIRRGDAKRVEGVEAALVASGYELVEQATAPKGTRSRATKKP